MLTPHLLKLNSDFGEGFYDDRDEDVFDQPSDEEDEREEIKIALCRIQTVDRSMDEKYEREEIKIALCRIQNVARSMAIWMRNRSMLKVRLHFVYC